MAQQKISHIAIIPDGNRRWAKQRGQLAIKGHKYALDVTLPAIYEELLQLRIPYCTFWVLSPENFVKRSRFEIQHLLGLIEPFSNKYLEDMHSKNIRIRFIGDIDSLPESTQKYAAAAEEKTAHNTGMTFIFALNYGGRDEIVRSVNTLLAQHKPVSKETITSVLDTSSYPDPDLIIRTGGEKRTSGFLLWQSEYSEYIFLEEFFPDFTPQLLRECIEEFHNRKRRYGK